IRYSSVTGVQTCALPISQRLEAAVGQHGLRHPPALDHALTFGGATSGSWCRSRHLSTNAYRVRYPRHANGTVAAEGIAGFGTGRSEERRVGTGDGDGVGW